jgi:hypothetical protein
MSASILFSSCCMTAVCIGSTLGSPRMSRLNRESPLQGEDKRSEVLFLTRRKVGKWAIVKRLALANSQRSPGSYAERHLGQTAGVLRFRSSLGG